MSQSKRFPAAQLEPLANRLMLDLMPWARRIVLAGSLRRRQSEAGDIDLVMEPRGPALIVRNLAARWGTLVKKGERFIQVIHRETGVTVDLFVVKPPAQWGVILVARTGPTALWLASQEALKRRGMETEHGQVRRGSAPVPCPDEETYFKLCGLPYLPPEQRDSPAALTPVA